MLIFITIITINFQIKVPKDLSKKTKAFIIAAVLSIWVKINKYFLLIFVQIKIFRKILIK